MSKKINATPQSEESQGFELIETAIDNLDLLTRAFDLIAEVCEELNDPEINLDPERPRIVMH